MKWLQANAVVVLSLLVVGWLGYALVRALVIALRRRTPPSVGEEFSRAEQVKHEIRRTIAQRKANPPPPQPALLPKPGISRGVPPIDPFGGPTRRFWARMRQWFHANRDEHVKFRA